MSAPVLVASEARVAVDGVVAIDRITLETQGDRVLFAGDCAALFGAITGVPLSARRGAGAGSPDPRGRISAPHRDADDDDPGGESSVTAGALLLAGKDVATGLHLAVMGAAPLDPPLPPSFTAEEYVIWGARLAGASARAAKELAQTALARVELLRARTKRTSALTLPERRALVLAQAVVMSPEVLVAEAPLAGLDGAAAAYLLHAIAGASSGRRALISAARLDPGSPEGTLARSASHLVVLAGGAIALAGAPSELFSGAALVSVTVVGDAEGLRAELGARGLVLRGGPGRFSVTLPAGTGTKDVLLAARAARAQVIELVPVIG